jgi:amidophosphoribosyltransferase
MPTIQSKRNLIAKMKLIPVHELIEDKRIILVDDSIVRGTQLRDTTDFLFKSGAKEVHARPACPPITFGCKFLNFSRSNSELELIARQIIAKEEGEDVAREDGLYQSALQSPGRYDQGGGHRSRYALHVLLERERLKSINNIKFVK